MYHIGNTLGSDTRPQFPGTIGPIEDLSSFCADLTELFHGCLEAFVKVLEGVVEFLKPSTGGAWVVTRSRAFWRMFP